MATKSWRTEDWVAVYIGFLVIAVILAAFSWKWFDLGALRPTFRWTADSQIASSAPGWKASLDAIAKDRKDLAASTSSLKAALDKGDRAAIDKAAGALAKAGGRNTVPARARRRDPRPRGRDRGQGVRRREFDESAHRRYRRAAARRRGHRHHRRYVGGGHVRAFMIGFPVVFILAWLARVLAGNGLFVDYGIEYVVFALLLGLLISNTVGTPAWLRPAAQTEFYIKTGLVVLGAGLLFMEVIQAGALGILQAVLVVLVIWYFCFWLARKLRVDDDFAAMLSSSVAICGVSAAIATCGAIQGDKKKLSYVTSLVLIVAVPMMIVMPWIAKSFNMNDIVAGAWLGGTLDTSATVVAAGALISDAAMKTGVIVKLSQNALIGVAAFILVVWWAYKSGKQQGGAKPGAGVIWERFPKFVLGFLVASAVFSFFLPQPMVEGTRSVLSELRTWWFALAFVCIGLETRFLDLATMEGGRPAAAFLGAQLVNVLWTLLLAWLIFGGVIFPVPDIK